MRIIKVTSHNPYFIGMNLAIKDFAELICGNKGSQSLFYWNEPCNKVRPKSTGNYSDRHNPYFIGMNLAMINAEMEVAMLLRSQSLFYWNEP